MQRNLTNPHLAVMLTVLFWAGNAIAGRFAVGHISPMVLTTARWGLALAVILPIALPHLRRDWPIARANWLYLFLCGAFGYMGFNFFLYSALQTLPAVEVSLEQTAMPIAIFLINYAIYRTGVTWMQAVGYLLTVIGVLVVLSKGSPLNLFDGKGTLGIGDLFMLGAALCYGGYSVALRVKPAMHWMSFLTCLIAAAFAASIIGMGWEMAAGNAQFPASMQGFAVAIYAGIFPSLLSQGLYIYGVERLGPNLAGLYFNMIPIFAALLAVVLLGEALHPFHAVAFLLVVGGLLIAQRYKPAARRVQDEA